MIQQLREQVLRCHINLLDNTVEGLCNYEMTEVAATEPADAKAFEPRIFSVQYHPESAPGPQDSTYLFDRFISNMQLSKDSKN